MPYYFHAEKNRVLVDMCMVHNSYRLGIKTKLMKLILDDDNNGAILEVSVEKRAQYRRRQVVDLTVFPTSWWSTSS